MHFEISAWNCFDNKVRKLMSGLEPTQRKKGSGSLEQLLNSEADFSIANGDAVTVLSSIPDGSTDLILTDPPHSDRAPYLELSELWNAVLGLEPDFAREIVVSNARDRQKCVSEYNARMREFATVAIPKLSWRGAVVVQFNARDPLSWEFLREFESGVKGSGVSFRGTFPITYSANSVVQDNRKGALTSDFALIFAPTTLDVSQFSRLEGWTVVHPLETLEANASYVR